MSLVRDVLDDSQGFVNEILGHPCVLTNTKTKVSVSTFVMIKSDVEIFQDGQFVGYAVTGVFDRVSCNAKLGNTLVDSQTGEKYVLEGLRNKTPSKIEFVLGSR